MFISSIDNILIPYIISEKTKIGPIITLISILGGIKLFGIFGIILGPLFLGILLVMIYDTLAILREKNPRLRKFIWTEKERVEYRKLKNEKEIYL